MTAAGVCCASTSKEMFEKTPRDEAGGRPSPRAFNIRRAVPADGGVVFDIWRRSVRATHDFLSASDLRTIAADVRKLGLISMNPWLLCPPMGRPAGFLITSGSHIEGLFIAPEWMRRGGGSMLVRHARRLHGRLTVDVNEQNRTALKFYQARGFVRVGRSATDDTGRPFPLLHLSQPNSGMPTPVSPE